MIIHPDLHVLVISEPGKDVSWLHDGFTMSHLRLSHCTSLPDSLDGYDAVITAGVALGPLERDLLRYVDGGGGWLAMLRLSEEPLPGAFGVQPGPIGPSTELRILFQEANHPLATRLPDAIYVAGSYHFLEKVNPDVSTLLYTDWHYSHSPVWTTTTYGKGNLGCTTLQDFSSAMLRQVCHRLLRRWQGTAVAAETSLGVGILGYAPSVGQPHGIAAEHTHGLHLAAVCDLSPERLSQAAADFPRIERYNDAAAMAEDPGVDLVIVATAPNIHARLAIDMMNAGKHVLCEKPLALNRRETDTMEEAAKSNGVHLSCHQNRRWDQDFRAIHDCVQNGRIGELFYLETFVGGFHHPCGYWHSHSPVSGGTSFDWGAHYLDWIVGLMPAPIREVIGTRHKRVWHDVSNGDQERIQIRFADGREAEFIHSDIAAARKPKWYLLGTRGAIVGSWNDVTSVETDPLYYFHSTEIPATEMTPTLTLHAKSAGGDIEEIQPALPVRDPFAFHRNLADHILWGEPLAAPLADSVKVVRVLEAATRSMNNGGRVEVFADE